MSPLINFHVFFVDDNYSFVTLRFPRCPLIYTFKGDVNSITIGNGVSIGDQAMVHCSGVNGDYPCVIGDNVVVGAGAIVHGCTVESGSMIGEGAQVLDGANIKKNAIVAPGALVPSGKTVGSGQLWAGVPAKMVRDLTPAEIASIDKTVEENIDLSVLHAEEASKSWQEIAEEAYITEQEVNRNEYYFKRLTKDQMQFKEGELENHTIPGRVLDTEVSARQDLPSAARV